MKCHIYTRCGVLVKNTKLHVQDEHKDEGTLSRRSVRAASASWDFKGSCSRGFFRPDGSKTFKVWLGRGEGPCIAKLWHFGHQQSAQKYYF